MPVPGKLLAGFTLAIGQLPHPAVGSFGMHFAIDLHIGFGHSIDGIAILLGAQVRSRPIDHTMRRSSMLPK